MTLSGDAPTPALPTIMTGSATIQCARQYRKPRRDTNDIQLIAGFFYQQFGATRFRGREKYAIGRAGHIFLGSEYPDIRFHLVVVRRNVLVGDGPIVSQPVARPGGEIDGCKPQRDAAPVVGSAADNA